MASREKVFSLERCLASGRRFGYDPSMSTKERAIAAIDSLPEDSDMADILREIAFITGTDQARKEIARRMDYSVIFSPTSIRDLADSVAYIA